MPDDSPSGADVPSAGSGADVPASQPSETLLTQDQMNAAVARTKREATEKATREADVRYQAQLAERDAELQKYREAEQARADAEKTETQRAQEAAQRTAEQLSAAQAALAQREADLVTERRKASIAQYIAASQVYVPEVYLPSVYAGLDGDVSAEAVEARLTEARQRAEADAQALGFRLPDQTPAPRQAVGSPGQPPAAPPSPPESAGDAQRAADDLAAGVQSGSPDAMRAAAQRYGRRR